MKEFIIIIIIALLSLATIFLYKNEGLRQDKEKVKMTTKQLTLIVVLAALATVVGMFEIPLDIIVGAKFDFSEVIILIAFLVLGFKNASFVIILRSLVRFFMPAKSAMEADILWKILGEVIAIIASYLIIFSYMIVAKISKMKQKPLMYEQVDEPNKPGLVAYILGPIITSLFLLVGLTTFHVIITLPMQMSGNTHFTIFSLLKDPAYAGTTIFSMIKTIVTLFGLLNVIKGVITPVVFLAIKPQIERVYK